MRTRIPPLAQLILCGLVGWLVAKGLSEYTLVSVAIQSVGWALIALGSFVLLLSVRSFVREKTTVNPLLPGQVNTLVTTGLYRYSRNPMYFGMALLLAGFALLLQNLAALISPILFMLSVSYLQIIPEERVLKAKFGQSFIAYCQATRRWL